MTRARLISPAKTTAVAIIFIGVFALSLTNRLLPVLRGGGLSGVLGYDDAVYYAGAVGLVHGRMPYQDFLFLHPPGVLLALSPIAALGRSVGEVTGWEISRLVWMAMGCCTGVIVVHILLRVGNLAAAIGGGVYALFPGAVLVERTTLLEGLTNLCLAIALALLIPFFASPSPPTAGVRARHWVLAGAGALLGFATTVKIWGLVPLIVVGVFAGVTLGVRCALVIALGAAMAITAVCLPFFAPAPVEMWRMAVLDQIGRDRGDGVLERAAEVLTMSHAPYGDLGLLVVIIGIVGLIVAGVAAWSVRPFRVAVLILECTFGLLLALPTFFPHYLGALAVPIALVAGAITARLTRLVHRPPWRVALVAVGCVVVGLDVLALSRLESGESVPVRALGRAVQPATGCITSDDPSNLLALGVTGRNITRGCDLVVDLGGHSHHLSRGTSLSRRRNQEWQEFALRYLGSGQYALATRFDRGRGFTASTAAEIASWPVRIRADGFELREPPP